MVSITIFRTSNLTTNEDSFRATRRSHLAGSARDLKPHEAALHVAHDDRQPLAGGRDAVVGDIVSDRRRRVVGRDDAIQLTSLFVHIFVRQLD